MKVLERVLTGIALIVIPFLGIAASAHQIEHGSPTGAVIFGAISLIVIWELARLSWHWHKESVCIRPDSALPRMPLLRGRGDR